MGILTLLRNAFGRSRKARTAEAEGATPSQTPEPTVPSPSPSPEPTPTASIPEPRTSTPDDSEHDLVSAAFDKVTVPGPTGPVGEKGETGETGLDEPRPETPGADEPVVEAPVAETPAVDEPVVEDPVSETPAAEEAVAVADEPAVEPEPVTDEPVAEVAVVEEPAAEEKALEPTVDEPVAEEPKAVVADSGPESEPESAAATEVAPAAAQADEPAAADGDQAPQGPPAPDDETATGGAGGNDEAEGEAEAVDDAPLPQALLTAYNAARETLTTRNLTGTTAKVYLVLDRSASMRPYYKDGSAQALGEQALALAAHLDPEAKVHVVFFSTELDGTGELTLTDHENKIDDLHAGLGRMGRTSYHTAVEEVISHYEKSATTDPALVIFQTDGAPDARTPATQSLTDAAKKHPAVFFSFVAFGDPENKAFDYLRKLKSDNTAHFLAGETPRELTDQELYEGVLANWRP
ncbi:VWA domain-containing protein [Streptomyces sp. GESEQ-4]|uniref:VWA domain-containing protein n=1 Tax=Streptomyces sp. GESEQ-4 TaxID=2812655 RepID=UPI001B323B55|nr:VWA domain-containing protein [Streptomyces sp. GESEQ-4]